jgi:hypothetical protein
VLLRRLGLVVCPLLLLGLTLLIALFIILREGRSGDSKHQ